MTSSRRVMAKLVATRNHNGRIEISRSPATDAQSVHLSRMMFSSRCDSRNMVKAEVIS
jgi:hypothetical protein